MVTKHTRVKFKIHIVTCQPDNYGRNKELKFFRLIPIDAVLLGVLPVNERNGLFLTATQLHVTFPRGSD
jgi:hypothetical protein